MPILFGLLAAVGFGTADFLGGIAAKRNPTLAVVLATEALGLALLMIAIPLLPEGRPTFESWMWGGVAGIFGAVGIGLLFRGLAHGRMGVVSPVSAVVGALVPVAFGLAIGERPSVVQIVGIAVALPAVALVSSAPEHGVVREERRTLRESGFYDALFSGLALGTMLVALAQPGDETGPWPLVAVRISESALFVAAAIVTRTSLRIARGSRTIVAVAAALGVTALLSYLVGSRLGLVSIVAVLSGLYPAATVLLARAVLKERLSRMQAAGLLLALAGVAAIAAG